MAEEDLDKIVEYVVLVKIPLRYVFGRLTCLVDGERVDCEIIWNRQESMKVVDRVFSKEVSRGVFPLGPAVEIPGEKISIQMMMIDHSKGADDEH